MRQPRPALPPAALPLALAASPAAAVENGFYAGVAADWSIVDVDFDKTLRLDAATAGAAPAEFRDAGGAFSRRGAASDDGDIVGLKVLAGYRWRLSDRFYFAGELEAMKYDSEEVSGRVPPTDDANDNFNIWRGVWKFEKDHSFGINTKFGYAPGGGLLGDGGSVYALFGVRWLDGDVSASFTNDGDVSDIDRDGYSETPWRVGVGMEIGDADSWFDLQLSYADYDVDFAAGAPSEITNPHRTLDYEIEEWGLSLGYTRRFGD